MTAKTHQEARALFVLSKDYGELALAMLFLHGQEFATRAILMLPQPVYSTNKDSLPVSTSPYATLEDILSVVDTHKPDLVFLLSGYLLSHDRLLSLPSLDALVQQLRDRGCRIVTSDPFVGLSPHLTLSQLDTRMLFLGRPPLVRWLVRLGLRLLARHREVVRVRILEDLIHIYPTSAAPTDPGDRVRRLSFFNPKTVRPTGDPCGFRDRNGAARDPEPSRKDWLFVLSSTDLEIQNQLLGARVFTRLVAHMLYQASDAGRRPTLIGPPSIAKTVLREFPADGNVEVISFCPYVDFVTRLLDAEYVFYWNVFSCSLLMRLANELPVFFFDRGHLSRAVKPFYEVALSYHFGRWAPIYLDQGRRFDLGALADLAKQQKPAMRAIRNHWQPAATPQELVDQLLHARADL